MFPQEFPVWLAALSVTHSLAWEWRAGKATYRNRGTTAQHIEPLGIRLEGGQTVAVSWPPGETSYTVEVG